MKKIILFLVFASFFIACGSGSSDKSSIVELEVADSESVNSKRATGTISTTGEVDRYHVNLVETGRVLQIKCSSNTSRPDVDLLVNIFEMDSDGELRMIGGTHAVDGAIEPADLKVNLYIDSPKELYINVRDLQDNESSDNPYYLSAHYEAAADGNGNFENAIAITIDGETQQDAIGTIGDIDCFSFDVTTAGVYYTFINFSPVTGTSVRLSIELYNEDGELIESRNPGSSSETHMVHYLTPGSYKVAIDDEGKDDFDAASFYTIGVASNTVNEAFENDTSATASDGSLAASFTGASIDYYEDIDWYKVEITASGDIDIMELAFDSDASISYRLNLYIISDPDLADFDIESETAAYSHDFSGANDPAYSAMLKLDSLAADENYYLAVMPQVKSSITGNSPYTASVSTTSIIDADEADPGNDTDANAIDIPYGAGSGTDSGKIGYRGDVDWYKVVIPLSATDRVFSLELDIPSSNTVEYAFDLVRNVRQGEDSAYSLSKTLRHTDSDYRNVDLATGVVVPNQTADVDLGIDDATYYIKVYDYQNDDGEDLVYTINWSITDIPGAPAAAAGVTDPVYNDEKNERDETYTDDFRDSSDNVNIEYENGTSADFRVNNTMLDLSDAVTSTTVDTVTTLEMPWVSGYVDYQGDEDWYGVDLTEALDSDDTAWYYEIGVEIIAASSKVEYWWEYFPDSNHNNEVSEGACSSSEWTPCNSVAANGGDSDIALTDVNQSFPSGDQSTPWIGSRDDGYGWKGVVFFRVRDFNFLRTDTDTVNPDPDNDWGFDQPYFLRTIIKYHSGTACPTCE